MTAMVTNIDRLGNSDGEKDEIVNNIKKPPIMVALIISKSLEAMIMPKLINVIYTIHMISNNSLPLSISWL